MVDAEGARKRRELEARLFGLGATGQYPHGRLDEGDEGELRTALYVEGGKVVINFGKSVSWVCLPPAEARALADLLRAKADIAEGKV